MTLKTAKTALICTPPGMTLPSETEVGALAESMKTVGLLNPITVAGSHLVAGRHRLVAARLLGWKEIAVNSVKLGDLELRLATIDENLVRRVGTLLERDNAVAERKIIYEQLHPTARKGGDRRSTKAQAMHFDPGFAKDTAAKTQVSVRAVQASVQRATGIAPDVKERISATPIADSSDDMLQLARLEPEVQRKIAERAVERGMTVKQTVRSFKRDEQIAQVRAYVPPAGQFAALVVDPPWSYDDELDGSDAVRGGCPYPTMTIEQICNLQLPAADDCALFLWVTNSHLIDPGAYGRVVTAWGERYGFVPKQIRTWRKPKMGLGRVWRNSTEHLVRLERGRPVFAAVTQTTDFEAPSPGHSVKPAQAYADIEALCPSPSRCELFARAPRPGWATSGAELPKAKRRKLAIVDVAS